jgi:hypothetical protein
MLAIAPSSAKAAGQPTSLPEQMIDRAPVE